MSGTELLKLMPKAIGFFAIGDYPGVILSDNQGWIFEGGAINPRPITQSEVTKRGGTPETADYIAGLLDLQSGALDFLKKINLDNKSRRL